jgi:Ras-related protein Rab-1A
VDIIIRIIISNRKEMNIAKCVIVGDADVGKTSLAIRYAHNTYDSEGVSTIGVEFYTKTTSKGIKYNIWDTAGQEKFRSITTTYYRGASCVLICFSLANLQTFNNVSLYYDEVLRLCPKDVVIVLVGTFEDTNDRRIEHKIAKQFADYRGMQYTEVSSKTGSGVIELFEEILPEKIVFSEPIVQLKTVQQEYRCCR